MCLVANRRIVGLGCQTLAFVGQDFHNAAKFPLRCFFLRLAANGSLSKNHPFFNISLKYKQPFVIYTKYY